jgi:hypothetical protein
MDTPITIANDEGNMRPLSTSDSNLTGINLNAFYCILLQFTAISHDHKTGLPGGIDFDLDFDLDFDRAARLRATSFFCG